VRLSVAGNLLIAGEYLVLREGGLGLACAVEPRVRASADPADSWSVNATMGGEMRSWSPYAEAADQAIDSARPPSLPVAAAVFAQAERLWREGGLEARPLRIELDSSSFFSPDGRKAGYGSSAASAVALALILGRAAGLDGDELKAFALEAALLGHRAAQGGRGSGYDVYASTHGGLGLFVGGARPDWRPLPALRLPPAFLFPGPAPVASPDAVRCFHAWLERGGEGAQVALRRGGEAVAALADAAGSRGFSGRLREARDLGAALGAAIGVPAELAPPPGLEAAIVKASGAGDELGMAFFNGDGVGDAEAAGRFIEAGRNLGLRELKPAEGPLWLS
jgi:phosphomevalonate kinase